MSVDYEAYVNGFREIFRECTQENVIDVQKAITINIWNMKQLTFDQKVELITISHRIAEEFNQSFMVSMNT